MFQTERADKGFIVLASLFFFSMLLVTLWNFVNIQDMTYRLSYVNLVGLSLFSLGVFIRLVARRTLGKYFSSGLKTLQKHALIKSGIYKHIRHPAYLGSLLLSPAIPMIFSSFYGFLLALGIIPCFLYRIKIEETMLLKKFGDSYREYMKKTKKLLPYLY